MRIAILTLGHPHFFCRICSFNFPDYLFLCVPFEWASGGSHFGWFRTLGEDNLFTWIGMILTIFFFALV